MTFEDDFWPWYESQHLRRETRVIHALATAANAGCIVAGLWLGSWSLVALGPIVDHVFAQMSHRRFEGNRTRPWRHPLWHARAELRLFATTVGLRR